MRLMLCLQRLEMMRLLIITKMAYILLDVVNNV